MLRFTPSCNRVGSGAHSKLSFEVSPNNANTVYTEAVRDSLSDLTTVTVTPRHSRVRVRYTRRKPPAEWEEPVHGPITAANRGFYYCHRAQRSPRRSAGRMPPCPRPIPQPGFPTTTVRRYNIIRE